MQSEQLLPEGQVFENEMLTGPKVAEEPTEQASQQGSQGERISSQQVGLRLGVSH